MQDASQFSGEAKYSIAPPSGGSVRPPTRRKSGRLLALGLLGLVFVMGLLAGHYLKSEPATAMPRAGGYYLPVASRQLTVTLQPLCPSPRVEALLKQDSPSQITARRLASDPAALAELAAGLAELYPLSYRTADGMELPDSLFDFERQQYDTSATLDWLAENVDPTSFKTCGLLFCDVADEGYNFLFGQARLAGSVCIVSAYRMGQDLEGAKLSAEQRWRSIVRHELGHTLGLQHVPDRKSVMAFGNSLQELDTQGDTLTRADWKRLKELHPVRWNTK